MRRLSRTVRLAGALLSLVAAMIVGTSSAADLVTVLVSGEIDTVTGGGVFDGSFGVGSPFEASYTLDDDTTPCVSGGYNSVLCTGPNSFFEISLGSYTFSGSGSNVEVAIGEHAALGGAVYGVSVFQPLVTGPPLSASFIDARLGFEDSSGAALSGLDFFVLQDLAAWETAELSIDALQFTITGTIETLPEPSSSLLVASALLALAVARSWSR